jgi:hypothetical protein
VQLVLRTRVSALGHVRTLNLIMYYNVLDVNLLGHVHSYFSISIKNVHSLDRYVC